MSIVAFSDVDFPNGTYHRVAVDVVLFLVGVKLVCSGNRRGRTANGAVGLTDPRGAGHTEHAVGLTKNSFYEEKKIGRRQIWLSLPRELRNFADR